MRNPIADGLPAPRRPGKRGAAAQIAHELALLRQTVQTLVGDKRALIIERGQLLAAIARRDTQIRELRQRARQPEPAA